MYRPDPQFARLGSEFADVVAPADFPQTILRFRNQRVGFEGSVTINRRDYGVTWNAALEGGGVLVSDKVTLEFEISAIKNA